jgi:hypothetical protein
MLDAPGQQVKSGEKSDPGGAEGQRRDQENTDRNGARGPSRNDRGYNGEHYDKQRLAHDGFSVLCFVSKQMYP